MAVWDRETPWRQGHALTNEAAVTLGLVETVLRPLRWSYRTIATSPKVPKSNRMSR
jgi:hypothetical protein